MDAVSKLTIEELMSADIQADRAAAQDRSIGALKPGVLSPQGVAVAGTDGFLFIGNGANRWESQYRGELTVDPSWLEAWRRVLAGRQEKAAQAGVTLWNFIAPEKQVIYPDKRWPEGDVSGANRPVRQLLSHLGPEAQLIYPEAELAAARERAPAFFRRNSHWTGSGCYAAAAPLVAALGAPAHWAQAQFAYRRVHEAHDLSVHFMDPAPQEDAGWLALAGELVFDNRQFDKTGRHAGSRYEVRNPDAPDPRRLVIFGDSYAYDAGLTALLAVVFQHVTFVWSKAVVWETVAEQAADLVVWESAERFLATVPTI
jgi:alginate O-acetyltransferase complex protein AlgJ